MPRAAYRCGPPWRCRSGPGRTHPRRGSAVWSASAWRGRTPGCMRWNAKAKSPACCWGPRPHLRAGRRTRRPAAGRRSRSGSLPGSAAWPGSSACRAARRRSASGCPMRPPFMATPVRAAWLAAWKAKARCWPGRTTAARCRRSRAMTPRSRRWRGSFSAAWPGIRPGSRCRAAAIRPPRRRETRRRAISPAAWSAFCAAAWQTARQARRPRYTAAGLSAGWPGRCAAVRSQTATARAPSAGRT